VLNFGVTDGSPDPEATEGLLAGVRSMALLLDCFASGVSLGSRNDCQEKCAKISSMQMNTAAN
jgi:hypothetical protein